MRYVAFRPQSALRKEKESVRKSKQHTTVINVMKTLLCV